MATVTLSGIHKRYPNDAHAVRGVDMEIDDGELIVFVGPSGCGKSTLLRMVAGLETISEGEIAIDGRRINEVSPADRDVAMVFQNYALYPHMSVYKNLSFGLQLRFGGGLISRVISRLIQPRRAAENAVRRREIHERVTTTAERLGIVSLLKRKPHQLSGGERQRVALGRAIVRNPAAFLFDEPLSNLDAKLRGQLRTEIKRLHRQLNTTMIYVTHDQVEAMTLGDRIAVMNRGRLLQVGKPMDVYHQPASLFVARFIGALPMNLIEGRLAIGDGRPVFVSKSIEFELTAEDQKTLSTTPEGQITPGRRITIGIRPENLELRTGQHDRRDSLATAGPTAQVVVSSVDRLGDSTVVYLAVNGIAQATTQQSIESTSGTESESELKLEKQEILVRTDAFSSIEIGQSVEVELSMESMHWFDSQTEDNLKRLQTT